MRALPTSAIFPAPDHDHARCANDVIAHAESLCHRHDQRLTPIRRRVLEVLAASHKPLGAYEIMDRIAAGKTPPAPITIYRALDFLIDNGLVHRIASRNAFLACAHHHAAEAVIAFLICESCGAVGEAPAAALMRTLASAAEGSGFVPKKSVIEITGVCAHCRSAPCPSS